MTPTRPDRDPDRRRPAPPHPGFEPREIDVDMDVCRWCGGLVPATELHKTKHEEWEQRIAARLLSLSEALTRLSGSRDEYESMTTQPSGPVRAVSPGAPAGPDSNRPPGPTASEVPHG